MNGTDIMINQIGYLPNRKKCVFFKHAEVGETFNVINVETKEVVYIGEVIEKQFSAAAQEEVYLGEFSDLTVEGTYQITKGADQSSYIFKIETGVYDAVFKDAVRFFYMQRCGEELPEKYADKWAHPVCHMQKARIYGTDQLIDVSGGWHDAGDYGRYIVATSKVVADLILSYESNPAAFDRDFNVPRKEKQLPYILEEIKGQLLWMFKMQDEVSGGVYHKVTCAVFPEHHFMPQQEVDELIVCPISTSATATFAGVMAMAYEVYAKWDLELSKKCLEHAEQAWLYLSHTPSQTFKNPEGIRTGEYGGSGDLGHRYWAAAQLFKATQLHKYKTEAEHYAKMDLGLEYKQVDTLAFSYGWSDGSGYGDHAYARAQDADEKIKLMIKDRILRKASFAMQNAKEDGYKITPIDKSYMWGSNAHFLMFSSFLKEAYDIEKKDSYLDQAMQYVHYCLGMNPLGICYVTGYGTHCTRHPHHRPSIAQKEAFKGMLAGGPNYGKHDEVAQKELANMPGAKCYIDDSESFSTNEVDIYWNSELVCAMAKLGLIS